MNILLDVRTFLAFIISCNLVTVLLIAAYLWHHRDDATLNIFFCGKCIQTAAWAIALIRNGPFGIAAISLANSLLFVGYALETVALLKLTRTYDKAAYRFCLWVTLLSILGFNLVLIFDNHFNVRVVSASLSLAALLVLPIFRMIQGKNHSLLMHLMGCLYLALMISFLGRAALALFFYHAIESSSIGSSFIYGYTLITVNLAMILGSTGFILLLKEMTDRELVRLANYDDLTKTLNRRAFFERTKRFLEQCSKKQQKLSFVLFDVDQFKCINDTYGHDVGDRVLRDLSRRVYSQIDAEHLFSRFGGDEFAILMPGMDEEQSAVAAERIRSEIASAEINLPDKSLNYTISIGLLTVSPNRYVDVENLYIFCDNALYDAKKNGKNSVHRGQYQDEL
ncbi:GGDEF domain-containing protein [Sporolactobacillus shoreicorticis]|uniref:GGDEF domain-containing protein n=1 Tax=Sporolactobacillus shoreicorticis TaxID=1923877 RepID=A0ABW5S405_9BACL|nr:GGDEF domain-containing protein [Sporolactobacillus shoreicorticis]MCO7125849.1 GGDEF domain-containing protein [Sporolactobacillus shoreicorticis]